jgi:hypothetical protein
LLPSLSSKNKTSVDTGKRHPGPEHRLVRDVEVSAGVKEIETGTKRTGNLEAKGCSDNTGTQLLNYTDSHLRRQAS